jgi:hypothetical protein
MSIKVIATAPGYYGHYRESGDEFEVADEQALHHSWMERADGKQIKRPKVAQPQVAQPQTTGNNPAGALPRDPTLEADLS